MSTATLPPPIPKDRARDAARQFITHRDKLGKWRTPDLLMGWGRLYEFPPGTPAYKGKLTMGAIAEFVLAHAVEIE